MELSRHAERPQRRSAARPPDRAARSSRSLGPSCAGQGRRDAAGLIRHERQTALDAILAELAALQLSGGGGVVNAPAWAGFTTWELVRGSNVVRNLHLGAPLSAALTNGDDTLSITADCYSTAGTDAAITAALLAYYTSAQVDAVGTRATQDAETTSAITGALLAYYTSAQVDALLGDYRTASAQDVFTTNQIKLSRQRPQPATRIRPQFAT